MVAMFKEAVNVEDSYVLPSSSFEHNGTLDTEGFIISACSIGVLPYSVNVWWRKTLANFPSEAFDK